MIRAAIVWSCLVLFGMGLLLQLSENPVKLNLMALLPPSQQDYLVDRAVRHIGAQSEKRIIFLVKAPTKPELAARAREVADDVDATGFFVGSGNQLDTETLFHFRYQLLIAEDRERIRDGTITEAAFAELTGPAGAMRARTLAEDPLFLFQHYVESLFPNVRDVSLGFPVVRQERMFYGLIARELTPEATGLVAQRDVFRFLVSLRDEYPDEVYITGYPAFSSHGAWSAHREITTIGVFSVTVIVLLVAVVFRQARPLVLVIGAIGTAVLCGFAVTVTVFGEIHIITLVAGATLIGVSIDYAFHYFCHRLESPLPERSSSIVRALSIGMGSSVCAYLLLTLAPFPGLQQIAVFSATGLFVAWLIVVTCFPALYRPPEKTPAAVASVVHTAAYRIAAHLRDRARIWGPLFAVLVVIGIYSIDVSDDVRDLQTPAQFLVDDDARVRSVIRDLPDTRFLLVRGPSVASIVKTLGDIEPRLESLREAGAIERFVSPVNAWPPESQQQANWSLRDRALYGSGTMEAYLSRLGFSDEAIGNERHDFNDAQGRHLSIDTWARAAPPPWRYSWLPCGPAGCAALVLLYGLTDPGAVSGVAADTADVLYVDQVAATSGVMRDTRTQAAVLLAASFVLLFIMLGMILGFFQAAKVLSVPAGAILFTLAVNGILGTPFSLFNMFSLLLVLGISVDYAIFNHFAQPGDRYLSLAVFLAACTTIMAFGLLSLSATTALHAFGLTLLFGVLFALVASPLLRRGVW